VATDKQRSSLGTTLREHDGMLGGLIRNNPTAIVVLDGQQRVQLINPAFERLFGYTEAEIAGEKIAALLVPADSVSESNRIAASGLGGAAASTVTHRLRKDGTLVDVEVTFVPFTGTDDRSDGAYVFYRDLSAQRGAERHLRAQYAVIEALANSSTIENAAEWVLRAVAEALGWPVGAMWLVDKTSLRMRCVDFWCHPAIDAVAFEEKTRASEFKRGVGPGRTWEINAPTWIVDVTKEPKFSRRETALAAGLHAAFSFPMVLDGDVVGVVEFFTLSVLEPDETMLKTFAALGQQLGAFVGRTRAQEQLERFFTMSGDLLCIAHFDGYFTRVNNSWHRVLGYTSTELMSHPFIDLVHHEDRESTQAAIAELTEGKEIALFENRYRCKDGTYRWLSWTSTPKLDEQLIYAVAHDTTDRKLLEQQTQETLKMRNDFVSFVTHQLRTPLSGIKWMLELAKDTDEAEEKASYVADARESADRLISLVNDLLDASRLESGKLQVALEPMRLVQLTYDVLADVATLVKEKGHDLDIQHEPGIPISMLDPQLLRQVILNLLSNAIKYTPAGGRIEIRIRREGSVLHWSIKDSGIGISADSQKRLFEKFFRADNAHTVDTEGTGLGLYLVRLIVERLGGTITVESEVDRGTLFHFTLPLTVGDTP
jgi:PAS domain S-box-containing protein